MSSAGAEVARQGGGEGVRCLVGFGNPARQDDGLGPEVVAALRRLTPPDRRTRFIIRQELVPELAAELARAELVVLVDATTERLAGRGVRWRPLRPEPAAGSPLTHSLAPGMLLAMVAELYERRPRAFMVSIQGDEFGLGQGLSAGAAARARRAIRQLARLIR